MLLWLLFQYSLCLRQLFPVPLYLMHKLMAGVAREEAMPVPAGAVVTPVGEAVRQQWVDGIVTTTLVQLSVVS
ncbi:hypothetical protein AA106555_1202 [Neokomagataea thailandica NBRC 106555]|uniref:Secreted protein n=1 Tax=Neokomagataea thailandica NBRC 106555 TaxID=1223520 RepID=A0ABQ0QQC5_9PROT|nr:hypothetical protein AA106555_1202 [Neokomagataea thailandica NBRC 106555]